MDEMKPCPSCSGNAHKANSLCSHTVMPGCEKCGIYTETIVAWNALPREPAPLVWSSNPPKVVGLYTARLKEDEGPEDYEYSWQDEDDIARGARGWYSKWEFAGPFPVPKEDVK